MHQSVFAVCVVKICLYYVGRHLANDYQYFYLAGTGTMLKPVFWIHHTLYAVLFTAASCPLLIACLVGMSTVSLLMSIAKHVQISTEKAAQLYFVRNSLIHFQFMATYSTEFVDLTLRVFHCRRVSMCLLAHVCVLHYSSVTCPKTPCRLFTRKYSPLYTNRSYDVQRSLFKEE